MLSRCARFLIIWQNPSGQIYHRFVSGFYCDYKIGYFNQYGHTIIYIIDLLQYNSYRPTLKFRFKRRLIDYINKI